MARLSNAEKYLRHYAEPEVSALANLKVPPCHYALAIPAYDEDHDFLQRMTPLLKRHACLVILTINQPDSLAAPCSANRRLAQDLVRNLTVVNTSKDLTLHRVTDTSSYVLTIDRFSPGLSIPKKQGVGLARKIAADIAVTLIQQNIIKYPWIYTTDCDAFLPDNYFTALDNRDDAAAAIYPFAHDCGDNALGKATKLYEFSLHYYQRGLQWAGSPYAFHTLGSTLAIQANHYCKVRGFPKRSGGEDFYLLNKLAKTGDILQLENPRITLVARLSRRVPFGTGPAVEKIIAMDNPEAEFTLYNPECFYQLKKLLDAVKQTAGQLSGGLAGIDGTTRKVIEAMGILAALTQARLQSKQPEQFLRHFNTWFDAFRTLKFIHLLRDAGLQNVNVEEAKKLGAFILSAA